MTSNNTMTSSKKTILDTSPNMYLFIALFFIVYLFSARQLRYRRVRQALEAVNRDCGDATKSSDLPLYHAESVIWQLSAYEFPWIFNLSLQFALFRTYGIPTISGLLAKTNQLSKRSTAHRRYVDTSVLIVEMMTFPLSSPRSKLALERINYMHSLYKKQISNDDLLYTLSLFMCQPAVFIDSYEWRKLHTVEKMAMHRYWSEVGVRMGIQEIPPSFEATYAWATDYEERHMIPADVNANVAEATVCILLYFIPSIFHPTALQFIQAICGPRLRAAFYWPDPHPSMMIILNFLFRTRAFLIRNFYLPRLYPVMKCNLKAIDDSAPFLERRYYYQLWETDPWYVRSTWWNKYGPIGWLCWIMGWSIPGENYRGTSGYRIGDVGPELAEGKGVGNPTWDHGSLLGGGSIKYQDNDKPEGHTGDGNKCPMFPS